MRTVAAAAEATAASATTSARRAKAATGPRASTVGRKTVRWRSARWRAVTSVTEVRRRWPEIVAGTLALFTWIVVMVLKKDK